MEKSSFFNAEQDSLGNYDREYLAEDFAAYFSRFISNGVFPNPSTGLQVTEAESPNMTVVLNPGYAYINGYKYENTSPIVFPIGVADGQFDRDDAVFIRLDSLGRIIYSKLIKGSPSGAAVPPAVIRTEDYWDLCVAIIHVKAGVSRITNDLIEDTRMNAQLCGIVTNVVQSVDATTLYQQIQADLNRFQTESQAGFDRWTTEHKMDFERWMSENKGAFDAWFEDINSKLGTAPATALQKQVNTLFEATRGFGESFMGQKFYGNIGQDRIENISIKGRMEQPGVGDPSPKNIRPIQGIGMPVNQIKPLVSFESSEGRSLEVKSYIEPVQEGSGEPSPDNVRPIKGFAEAKLVRCGKNLLDTTTTQTINGVTFRVNPDKSITINGTPKSGSAIYYIQANMPTYGNQLVLSANNNNQQYNKWWVEAVVKKTDGATKYWPLTRDIPLGKDTIEIVNITIAVQAGTTLQNETVKLQVELGTVATPYEPYQGNEYTAQFGQTVYGGSYDWSSGKLIIDRVTKTFNGSEDWFVAPTDTSDIYRIKLSQVQNILPPSSASVAAPLTTCNMYTVISASKTFSKTTGVSVDSSGAVIVYDPKYNTNNVALWKELLAKSNLQLVYGLKKPLEVALTPQQIPALSGTNTLYSDTGDTQVQTEPFTLVRLKDSKGEHFSGIELSAPLFEGDKIDTNVKASGGRKSLEARKSDWLIVDGVNTKFVEKQLGNITAWSLPNITPDILSVLACSHLPLSDLLVNSSERAIFTKPELMAKYNFSTVEALNQYCREQYAGANPLTIVYSKSKIETKQHPPITVGNTRGLVTATAEDSFEIFFYALAGSDDISELDQRISKITQDLNQFNVHTIQPGEDLNNYKKKGTYFFPESATPSNAPPVVDGWVVVIPNEGVTAVKQICLRLGTEERNDWEMYVRTWGAVSTKWSKWVKIATEKEISSVLNTANTALSTANTALSKANAAMPMSGGEFSGPVGNANDVNVTGRWFRNTTVVDSSWSPQPSQWITLVRK